MKKRISLLLVMVMSLAMMLTGCSASSNASSGSSSSNSDDEFRVGMECGYAPFNWTQSDDSNGGVKIQGNDEYAGGYDVQIAQKIADGLGKKLVIVKTEWDGLVPAVQSGKIDAIIAGMSPTAERKESIDFTDVYYTSDLVMVVKKGGKYENATKLSDFKGATITGQLNTFHYTVIDQIDGVKKDTAMDNFPAMRVALEVGLGGRYDATNVIKDSLASVIVSLSLDHIGILGDTLGKIAYEKAGIIKPNGLTISYKQKEEAAEVIKDVCKEQNSEYIEVDFDSINVKKSDVSSQMFDCTIDGEKFEDMEIQLIGDHQVNNAVLALTVLKAIRDKRGVELSNEAIKKGFHDTKWPGRIEKIKDNPVFIIDGAHNEDGARSLTNALEKNFKGKKLTFLIGMLADKDIDSVLDLLMDKFEKVVTTTPDSDRAISCEELKAKIEKYGKEVVAIPKIEDAVQYVLDHAEKDEVIIAAGSLYMIGHIRSIVK